MTNQKSFYENRWQNDSEGIFDMYERNRVLKTFFSNISKNHKLLDLCCGDGTASAYFQKLGFIVWGVDISQTAIKAAQKKISGHFQVVDIEKRLPFKTHFFDVVFWGDGIEHMFFPEKVLFEIKRVLKTSGRIVLSVPNTGFWLYRWHYFKTGTLPITEGHKVALWETGHIRYFSLDVLKNLLNKVGFEITLVKGAAKDGIHSLFGKLSPSLFAPIMLLEAKQI